MKKNIFEAAADIFETAKVDYVLIGGFAVNTYGIARNTADVDFLAPEEDRVKLLKEFEKHDFKISNQTPIFARLTSEKFTMDLDLLFVDAETLKEVAAHGKSVTITGRMLKVPSIDHLIALKLHAIKNDSAREASDTADIVELIRSVKINPTEASFRALCLKHGSASLYEKILTLTGDKK